MFEAKKDGRLTDDAARAVMKGALQNFLGQQGQQDTSVVDSSGVQEVMGAALDADKSSVKVTDEKAGEIQTVEVSKDAEPGGEGQPAPTKTQARTGPRNLIGRREQTSKLATYPQERSSQIGGSGAEVLCSLGLGITTGPIGKVRWWRPVPSLST